MSRGTPAGPSRLERMLERLTTQRACLAAAASLIAGRPGPVLEIGLGKGRTYDHLRRLLPEREIFVFDRSLHAPADSVPDAGHLMLGDFLDTLPAVLPRLGAGAALAHADIGTEDRAADARLAARLGRVLAPLMARGAVVLSDRALTVDAWDGMGLPAGVGDWAYFMYRVG